MDDITNNINNIGKPVKDQSFAVKVSYGELLSLKALAQNIHPNYMEDPEMVEHFKKIYHDLRFITNQIEEREAYKHNRDSSLNL